MANLTITVEEQVLERARMRALEDTLVINAVLRNYLEDYAGANSEQQRASERIFASSRESKTGSGPDGCTCRREDLYEERLGLCRRK